MGKRPRNQAGGTPMSQSMRDAQEIALDGTAAVVQDVAGHPGGRERLRAGVKRATARGAPQVPEGREAEARPKRLQRQSNRPAAVVASEEHSRSERRRQLACYRSPHLRQPGHHRARDNTGEENMTQRLASASAGRVWSMSTS